jgi:SRSO17 transposase
LERFLVDLSALFGRSERRHWGAVYLRGLLLDGERKSVEPMAARLSDGNVQAMQQFVGICPEGTEVPELVSITPFSGADWGLTSIYMFAYIYE